MAVQGTRDFFQIDDVRKLKVQMQLLRSYIVELESMPSTLATNLSRGPKYTQDLHPAIIMGNIQDVINFIGRQTNKESAIKYVLNKTSQWYDFEMAHAVIEKFIASDPLLDDTFRHAVSLHDNFHGGDLYGSSLHLKFLACLIEDGVNADTVAEVCHALKSAGKELIIRSFLQENLAARVADLTPDVQEEGMRWSLHR